MKVFIFEHICGGCDEEVPAALADAGTAMWRAVTEDFAASGHEVLTRTGQRTDSTRDGRAMARITPPAAMETVLAAAAECDAALVIAPESACIALNWARKLNAWPIRSLGSSPPAIALCSDKLALCKHLTTCDVAAPRTVAGDQESLLKSDHIDFAQGESGILKPRDGAGCESTFLIRGAAELTRLRERLLSGHAAGAAPLAEGESWILQPYCVGQPASVSFIVHEHRVIPLRAGVQLIDFGAELSYRGGAIPLPDVLARRAIAIAERAVRCVPGLRGFVGVDVVLGDRAAKDVVIEVNPRVTMSYCGLRRLSRVNLASTLLDANIEPSWRGGRVRFDNTGRVEEY